MANLPVYNILAVPDANVYLKNDYYEEMTGKQPAVEERVILMFEKDEYTKDELTEESFYPIGLTGEITEVNTGVITDATKNGYIPIISTIAGGYNGAVYNINADLAAARIAAELKAAKLILMTDIKGLLKDKDDDSTLIPQVNVSEVPYLKSTGIISGGMIPKIECCVEAVRRGVKRTSIIDGRVPHSILIELLTNEGIGTQFS